jgi:hypothetical protein
VTAPLNIYIYIYIYREREREREKEIERGRDICWVLRDMPGSINFASLKSKPSPKRCPRPQIRPQIDSNFYHLGVLWRSLWGRASQAKRFLGCFRSPRSVLGVIPEVLFHSTPALKRHQIQGHQRHKLLIICTFQFHKSWAMLLERWSFLLGMPLLALPTFLGLHLREVVASLNSIIF